MTMSTVYILKFTVLGAASLWEMSANPERLQEPVLKGAVTPTLQLC